VKKGKQDRRYSRILLCRDIEYNFSDGQESFSGNFLTKVPSPMSIRIPMSLSCKDKMSRVRKYMIGSIDRNGYLCVDSMRVASNLKTLA
jgi:hypothetical protein